MNTQASVAIIQPCGQPGASRSRSAAPARDCPARPAPHGPGPAHAKAHAKAHARSSPLLAARMGAMMTMRAMSSTTITQHIFLRTFFWYFVAERSSSTALPV